MSTAVLQMGGSGWDPAGKGPQEALSPPTLTSAPDTRQTDEGGGWRRGPGAQGWLNGVNSEPE